MSTDPGADPALDDVLVPEEDAHPDHREHAKAPRPIDQEQLDERAAHEQRQVEADRRRAEG